MNLSEKQDEKNQIPINMTCPGYVVDPVTQQMFMKCFCTLWKKGQDPNPQTSFLMIAYQKMNERYLPKSWDAH